MLVKQVELLTARLEKVEREGKRQAAPFRKKRKAEPTTDYRKQTCSVVVAIDWQPRTNFEPSHPC